MTSVVIFTGPTLSAERGVTWLPHAEFRPPAECGDVLRAVLRGVRTIGLVDGYFEHRLSVWHKEILWAISRGVAVYGAASMGALRAAELATFGMIGVGEVFEAYARRELEDDDEVAVSHEAAERAHRPTSEAMVNLRATLARAVDETLISDGAAQALIERQKALFYPERSLPRLMADAGELLAADQAGPFCRWLRERGIVNQKLADAEALMQRIATDLAAGLCEPRTAIGIEFPHTNAWQALFERVTASSAESVAEQIRAGDPRGTVAASIGASVDDEAREPPPATPDIRSMLAELEQQDPALHTRIWQLALERAVAVALAQSLGHQVGGARLQAEADRFRRELGLLTPEQTSEWLRANDLDVPGFSRLLADTVSSRELAAPVRQAMDSQLLNVLRLVGQYQRASER